MGHQSTTADRIIAALAALAHGVVTRIELLDAGVTPKEIRIRLKRGSLLPVFPGVYRVGHAAASTEATYMAAVKAAGDEAVLAGRAAAHLQGLIRGGPPPAEVIAPTKRRIKGVRTSRISLPPTERTTYKRIPVTTLARTLLDLAAVLDDDALARACHEAEVRNADVRNQLTSLLARHKNAPGSAKLRAILDGETKLTLSHLERAFVRILKQHNLPLPQTNKKTGARYLDCRWPAHTLTVELDSYRFHKTRHAWEQDRRREREAYARGDQFRRYTYADVTQSPRLMLRELRALLA